MYTVQEKTSCSGAKPLLLKAMREQRDLSWDRFEALQPQCGFGRLGISCTDCFDGPCRVNPFGSDEQRTICGRDREDLVANFILQKAYAGAEALTALAEVYGAGEKAREGRCWNASDSYLGKADMPRELDALSRWAGKAMRALSQCRPAPQKPYATTAGFGVLPEDTAAILVHGNLPPTLLAQLAEGAKENGVALVGGCGGEGYYGIPVAANYGSQELVLLSGRVDLAIVGKQDVTPAFKRLAADLGIPLHCACELATPEAMKAVFATAKKQYGNRPAGKRTPLCDAVTLCTGFGVESCKQLLANLKKTSGLAYIGGSGNIAHTQDADIVQLARNILDQGYILATSGGAGTALARAGLCNPDFAIPASLRAALPEGFPAVLHLGAGYDAAIFMDMAARCKTDGIPVFAAMPEIVSAKDMAIAAGIAGEGIPVYLDSALFPWLPESLVSGNLQSLGALTEQRLAS